LVDSPKVKGKPGTHVNLKAVAAPNAKAAAQYYPAQYWSALLQVPPKSDFPGTGPQGNGISPTMKRRLHRLSPAWRKSDARNPTEPRHV
jgi:hypothetical protein